MTRLRLVAVALLVLSFCSCLVLSAAESNHPIVSKISTQSGGHRIRIDEYATSRSGKHPAILVLHGAGGTLLDGPEMRRVARQLAEAGNTVYLVHYFNRTGTIVALDAGMQKNFPAWLETIRDSVQFAQQEGGDKSAVGMFTRPGISTRRERITLRGQDWRGIVRRRRAVELRIKKFCHRRVFVGDPDRLFQPRLAQFR